MIVYLILTAFMGADIRIDRIVYSTMEGCLEERGRIMLGEMEFTDGQEIYVSECVRWEIG